MAQNKAQKKAQEVMHDLEEQFQSLQTKLTNAKDDYIHSHRNDYEGAKKGYQRQKKKLDAATAKVAKGAERARKTGTRSAQNQLKKANAAAAVLRGALGEARAIMTTAQDKLNTAKPFEKKLAARAKALAAFERDWEKKEKAAEKATAERAKKRKSAAKKKTPAK